MTREDAILHMILRREELKNSVGDLDEDIKAFDMAIEALEQEPCEMTAEEYRQRMIQAFHNAGTDELIAVCVLPTAKEFEYLEWLLKNHYKKEPCDDAISRQAVLDAMCDASIPIVYKGKPSFVVDYVRVITDLPSVSTEKTGRCKDCKYFEYDSFEKINGMQLIVAHEICSKWADGCKTRKDGYCFLFEPQESEDAE